MNHAMHEMYYLQAFSTKMVHLPQPHINIENASFHSLGFYPSDFQRNQLYELILLNTP